MTPKETLLKAADILETKGWTQEYFARNKKGEMTNVIGDATCFCAMGAISAAEGGPYVSIYDKETVKYLGEHVDDLVFRWNDAPDQTAVNVIKIMRECAESLS